MALEPAPGESAYASIAVVNTRLLRSGSMVDLLADAPAAGAWLELHGSGAPVALSTPVVLSASEAAQLIELREAIRALFEARATSQPPPARAVTTVNAAAATAPLVPGLMWTRADGLRIVEQRLGRSTGTKAMAYLAADAMNLLTSPSSAELAACGAHGCVRWFLRTHASRQWCSTRCGDRVRAARHYARHHPGDTVLSCSPNV
jgi:predicted RNA-binding Zn ribbon-like protein